MNTLAMVIGYIVMTAAGIALTCAVVWLTTLWMMGRILFLMDGSRAFYDFCRARGRERSRNLSDGRSSKGKDPG